MDVPEHRSIISGIGISRIGRRTGIPGIDLTVERLEGVGIGHECGVRLARGQRGLAQLRDPCGLERLLHLGVGAEGRAVDARKPGALRNGAPFADLPAPLAALRRGLLKHEGGDRAMAKVLAAVPAHGLEAVLVAVELVLESGGLSVEHVMNVIGRINHPPPLANVETALVLQEVPLADTGRYDALRTAEVNHA